MNAKRKRPARAHRRLLDLPDEDPLSAMANLFDTGMVFAVALLIALVSFYQMPELLSGAGRAQLAKKAGTPALEALRAKGVLLEHFRESENILGGEGERLGTAYRLQSGDVVYVPDAQGQ